MSWKVKSARVKDDVLVITAEREIPLAKILDNEVLKDEPEEEEEEAGVSDVSDEEAKQRLGIDGEELGDEPEEEEEDEKLVEVAERSDKLQDKIEEVEMVTASPVSKLKGQKGRILASLEAGNETLAKVSEETNIVYGSASGQLTWLIKNSFVKRVGKGHYKITAKGKIYLKKLEKM